jgi:hypothetical protein
LLAFSLIHLWSRSGMPLELHIENANLSDSHYSSLLIAGVAQHRLGIRARQFSRDGQSGQRYLVVVASRSFDPRRDTVFIFL